MISKIRACTLVSGSSGNSVYIESGYSRILVDAGGSCKKIESNMSILGLDPLLLDGILITHEHSDHISAASVLARKYNIPIYSSRDTLAACKLKMRYSDRIEFREVEFSQPFQIGDLSITGFHVSHDGIDPLAYKIDTGFGIISVVTDIGVWTPYIAEALSGSDLIFLEANYDEDMLWNGHYPYPLKRRVASDHGHLSNEASAKAALGLLESGTKRFVLIHLSNNNNHPDLAYEYFETYLADNGFINGIDYTLSTANRYDPGLWQVL